MVGWPLSTLFFRLLLLLSHVNTIHGVLAQTAVPLKHFSSHLCWYILSHLQFAFTVAARVSRACPQSRAQATWCPRFRPNAIHLRGIVRMIVCACSRWSIPLGWDAYTPSGPSTSHAIRQRYIIKIAASTRI